MKKKASEFRKMPFEVPLQEAFVLFIRLKDAQRQRERRNLKAKPLCSPQMTAAYIGHSFITETPNPHICARSRVSLL